MRQLIEAALEICCSNKNFQQDCLEIKNSIFNVTDQERSYEDTENHDIMLKVI